MILFFWSKFVQYGIFSLNQEKNEHHHRILSIQISLCTKFQLKLRIFWDEILVKGISGHKGKN